MRSTTTDGIDSLEVMKEIFGREPDGKGGFRDSEQTETTKIEVLIRRPTRGE
jgi:hypothetical protein